jgi:hypothetical protein
MFVFVCVVFKIECTTFGEGLACFIAVVVLASSLVPQKILARSVFHGACRREKSIRGNDNARVPEDGLIRFDSIDSEAPLYGSTMLNNIHHHPPLPVHCRAATHPDRTATIYFIPWRLKIAWQTTRRLSEMASTRTMTMILVSFKKNDENFIWLDADIEDHHVIGLIIICLTILILAS